MKIKALFFAALVATGAQAQTNVTKKYIDNPDFAARFAGWENADMKFNTATKTFAKSNGEVWMEKFVNSGSKIGNNAGMRQRLVDLTPGTYTLTVGAQNIQQSKKDEQQTGAFLFAGDEKTEIHAADDYTVRFTLLTGQTTIGVKMESCTGNWVCIDNFRLQYEGFLSEEADAALQKLVDEAESIYNADGNTAAELRQAIDEAKAAMGQLTDKTASPLATALQRATLNYRVQNATGATPKVTTHPYVAQGTTIALGRLTASGTGIQESGFCWSTNPEPTILDYKTTRAFSNKGNIYVMDKMAPATIYYVRAYAMTKNYQVGYGDVVKIATLPYGKVTCDYDYAGNEQQNYRINSATQECIWLWNNLCHIEGKNISVHYVENCGSEGRTADCNINGWMRVSYNEPYQQTGTMFHETNHGMGVGTTASWYDNPILRSNTSRGDWLGPRATQMVRFFENSETAVLTGDGTHMWPYGINGAHEDQYNPENTCLYYANALITHALHQDGLCYQWWGTMPTPAYVFQQIDNQKYYLKCESEDAGLHTGYLTMSSTGKLQVQEITTFEATEDDNFAWNITYDPATALYMLYNVGTGRYMSYASNTIKGVKKTKPTASEKFQLMPSRQNVQYDKLNMPSYWVIKESGAVLEGKIGDTKTAGWDANNSATKQRWLLISETDANDIVAEEASELATDLTSALPHMRALLAVPHDITIDSSVEEVDARFLEAIVTAESTLASSPNTKQLQETSEALYKAMNHFLHVTIPTIITRPFDLSFMLVNPQIDGNCDGWSKSAGFSKSNSLCEYTKAKFDFNQTTKQAVPCGTYRLSAQAFQRPGTYDVCYTDYITNGQNNVDTELYAGENAKKVKHIWDDAQETSLGGVVKKVDGLCVPDNARAAAKCFEAGLYENNLFFTFSEDEQPLTVGIRSTTATANYWTSFDNFRLYFYGNIEGTYTIEQLETPVNSILATPASDVYFDLSGRRVLQPSRGIYIKNGQKILIK